MAGAAAQIDADPCSGSQTVLGHDLLGQGAIDRGEYGFRQLDHVQRILARGLPGPGRRGDLGGDPGSTHQADHRQVPDGRPCSHVLGSPL